MPQRDKARNRSTGVDLSPSGEPTQGLGVPIGQTKTSDTEVVNGNGIIRGERCSGAAPKILQLGPTSPAL